jgi:hypothetical protein
VLDFKSEGLNSRGISVEEVCKFLELFMINYCIKKCVKGNMLPNFIASFFTSHTELSYPKSF